MEELEKKFIEKVKFFVRVVCATCGEVMGSREYPEGEYDTDVPGCCRKCIREILTDKSIPD